MSVKVTFEVDDAFYAKLQALAHDMEYPLDDVCRMALEDFYAEERESVDDLLEGLRDHEEGRSVSHEEVRAWILSLATENPLPNPAARFEQKLAS